MNPEGMHDQPPPTLWPIGFAIGVAVVLVGLIVNPMWISSVGGAIMVVFGFLWARDATSELRGHPIVVEPERRDVGEPVDHVAPPATAGGPAMPPPEPGERFPRSKFLEGSTLGIGALIGGLVTVPIAGFAVLPPFLAQKKHPVDLGPAADFTDGQWYIATFTVDPKEAETSSRTAFIRNNGSVVKNGKQVPSFTVISNRCAHLGCPVQANGPTGAILGMSNKVEHTVNGPILLRPVVPAGFGCPCHGGQYDTEGNRTAGPPVRALDRWAFEIVNGHLILSNIYSVSHVDGQGAQAQIHAYKSVGPGIHVDGVEQILYPLNPPHH